MKNQNTYKIKDLINALDRDKTTILRWEKQGFIPPAKRDSRGWRYYTDDDFQGIVKKVKESHYFNRRLATMIIVFILFINAIAFFTISKFAFGNANLNANLNVAAGALSVTASSTVTAFSSITYSFFAQSSTAANVGSVGVKDLRGGTGVWTLNVSCADSAFDCMWKGASEKDRFATFKGASVGGTASTSGLMCLDLSQNRCVPTTTTGTQPCSTVTTQTAFSCFDSVKTDISFASGSGSNGEYWFAETDWAQAVPGFTTASVYTTTLIWDLSRTDDSRS